MLVFPIMYRRKRLSRATMSGSGYWIGCCPDQSRGVAFGDTGCGGVGFCAAIRTAVPLQTAAARKDRRFHSELEIPFRTESAICVCVIPQTRMGVISWRCCLAKLFHQTVQPEDRRTCFASLP